MKTRYSVQRGLAGLLAAAAVAAATTGCVPLVLGGAAVGGALLVTDRRTSGAQLEDEGIEKFIKPYDKMLQAIEKQKQLMNA